MNIIRYTTSLFLFASSYHYLVLSVRYSLSGVGMKIYAPDPKIEMLLNLLCFFSLVFALLVVFLGSRRYFLYIGAVLLLIHAVLLIPVIQKRVLTLKTMNIPKINIQNRSISTDYTITSYLTKKNALLTVTIIIDESKTLVKKYGTVYFLTTEAYLKSKNIKDAIPGLGPVLVEKNGNIVEFPSSVPFDVSLQEYEENLGK